jgi:VanZ family protein
MRRSKILGFIIGWGIVLSISILSLIPPIDTGIETISHIDKFEHLTAYFVMMFWFCQLYPTPQQRLICLIGFLAMGLGLEFLQSFTSTRHTDGFDMIANAIGVFSAWFISQQYLSHQPKNLAEK